MLTDVGWDREQKHLGPSGLSEALAGLHKSTAGSVLKTILCLFGGKLQL